LLYRKGSVVVLAVVSLSSQFKNSDSPILVQEINKVGTIAGFEFDKSYTKDEGTTVIKPYHIQSKIY
jgi:hypothetical protein